LKPGRIPVEPIAPILRKYLAEFEMRRIAANNSYPGPAPSPLVVLADEMGVSYDSLYDILRSRKRSIDFNMADLMLCKMGLVHLWRSPALRDIYEGVDLT
jgi:hypothetical protein